MMCNKCSMGTLTKKPKKAESLSTINMSVIMTQHYPQKFVILHMVGGVVNSTKKNLFLQKYDRKRDPSNGHTSWLL